MIDDLPAAIDIYLLSLGFYPPDRAPGAKKHAKIHIREEKEPAYVPWKPAYAGEEPPF